MNKVEVVRRQLKQNIMKEAIFRIDYTGIISIEEILVGFRNKFKDAFADYEMTFHNRIDLGTVNIEEVSQSLAIPVKELERQHIHRFKKNSFGPDEVIFDIGKYFTFLHIICKDYQTIDPYLDFFVRYLTFLKEINPYTTFKRFGLRKIGYEIFFNADEIFENFEKAYFYSPLENKSFKRKANNFVDVVISDDDVFQFNFRRSCDSGFFRDGEEIKPAYQVTLDIDGYMTEDSIKSFGFEKPENIRETIERLNNKYLFELFKLGVTETFLEKNTI